MATLRGSSGSYEVGNTPPTVRWTVVRGDTAAFKVYVTDDAKQPLNLADWTMQMDIKRDDQLIMTLTPEQDPDDADGEFTVSLTALESEVLETDDIFDIELRTAQDQNVWTVAQGSMFIIEDITNG